MHSRRVIYDECSKQRYPDYGTWTCQFCYFDDNIYYWARCNECQKVPYHKKLPTPGTRRIAPQDGVHTKNVPSDARRRRWRNLATATPGYQDGGGRPVHTPDKRAGVRFIDDSPEKLVAGLQKYLSSDLLAQAQLEIEQTKQAKKTTQEAMLAQNNLANEVQRLHAQYVQEGKLIRSHREELNGLQSLFKLRIERHFQKEGERVRQREAKLRQLYQDACARANTLERDLQDARQKLREVPAPPTLGAATECTRALPTLTRPESEAIKKAVQEIAPVRGLSEEESTGLADLMQAYLATLSQNPAGITPAGAQNPAPMDDDAEQSKVGKPEIPIHKQPFLGPALDDTTLRRLCAEVPAQLDLLGGDLQEVLVRQEQAAYVQADDTKSLYLAQIEAQAERQKQATIAAGEQQYEMQRAQAEHEQIAKERAAAADAAAGHANHQHPGDPNAQTPLLLHLEHPSPDAPLFVSRYQGTPQQQQYEEAIAGAAAALQQQHAAAAQAAAMVGFAPHIDIGAAAQTPIQDASAADAPTYRPVQRAKSIVRREELGSRPRPTQPGPPDDDNL